MFVQNVWTIFFFIKNTHTCKKKKTHLKSIKAYILEFLEEFKQFVLKNLKHIIGHSQSFRPWSLSSAMVYLSSRTYKRWGSYIKLGQGLWQRTKGSMSGYTKTNFSVDYLIVLCQCLIICTHLSLDQLRIQSLLCVSMNSCCSGDLILIP